jgi:hypothetical protein
MEDQNDEKIDSLSIQIGTLKEVRENCEMPLVSCMVVTVDDPQYSFGSEGTEPVFG